MEDQYIMNSPLRENTFNSLEIKNQLCEVDNEELDENFYNCFKILDKNKNDDEDYNSNCIELNESNEKDIEKSVPELYKLSKIKDILIQKMSLDSSKILKEILSSEEEMENVEETISEQYNFILGKKKKKIFKINEDNEIKKHDKYCGDNLIKKIKYKLLKNFLEFVNDVIISSLKEEKLLDYIKMLRESQKKVKKLEPIIRMINYKILERLNRNDDLSLLNTSFKDIFSQKVSPSCSKINEDSNKKIIQKLIEEENDNNNITFALNLRFKDYIDIFLYKKELTSFMNFNMDQMQIINKCLDHMGNLILELYKSYKEEKLYLLHYLMFLYNYERWFYFKRGRIRKKKLQD